MLVVWCFGDGFRLQGVVAGGLCAWCTVFDVLLLLYLVAVLLLCGFGRFFGFARFVCWLFVLLG